MTDQLERIKAALASRYVVEDHLGSGGMATVYLAVDSRHQRRVAIKVLRSEIAESLGSERFLREIQIAAQLQHPHILPLYDSGEAAGLLYYVMPHVEGVSLRERIDRETQLPLEDAVKITREIGQALSYSHERGIIHRDIKPDNILLSAGTAVVSDFGIARAISEAGSTRLTETGVSIGTPFYMSPEQATGEDKLDTRSDLYSLACVLYEMLVGQVPFTGPSTRAVMMRHLVDPVPGIRTIREAVPEHVESAVMRALEKAPADRFASVDEFVGALTSSEAAGEATAARPRRSRLRAAAFAGLGLAAIVAGVAIGTRLFQRQELPAGSGQPMIAVLPFEHVGPPEDGYFADGMTDEIASRISRISGLGLISSASASQYDRSETPIKEIGRELGVDYVLAGSVRTDRGREGAGTVRVTPHLLRVSDDLDLWSNTYDAEFVPGELFQVQEAIAEGVADALNVTLLLPERLALKERLTDNLKAYEAYMRGNVYASHGFAEEPTRLAIESYQEAVALDSSFAMAHAKLSRAHSLYFFFFDRSAERLSQARAAVDQALAIDSTLNEAHLALGYYHYWSALDYDRALEEFERVRQEEPNNSELLSAIGSVQRRQGKWDVALAAMTRAAQLDPRNQIYQLEIGVTNQALRRYDEAERAFDRAIELAPDWMPPYVSKSHLHLMSTGDVGQAQDVIHDALQYSDTATMLATLAGFPWQIPFLSSELRSAFERFTNSPVLIDPGQYYLAKADHYRWMDRTLESQAYYDSAYAIWNARVEALPGEARFLSRLGLAYAGLGRFEEAIEVGERATQLQPIAVDAAAAPFWQIDLALIYVLAGRPDDAIDALAEPLEKPSPIAIPLLRVHPNFDPLRGHPRFEELVRKR
jgi:serine/threonine-protein kinase